MFSLALINSLTSLTLELWSNCLNTDRHMSRTKIQFAVLFCHVIACISVWPKHWHCSCCQEACIHITNSAARSTETKSESRSRVVGAALLYHHALLLCSDWPPQSPRTSPGSPLPGTHWGRKGWRWQLHEPCMYIWHAVCRLLTATFGWIIMQNGSYVARQS